MTPLLPLWENILIELLAEEATSSSGILLPETKDKPWYGKVIAVGEWKTLDNGTLLKIWVVAWDIVYFAKYSPDEIEIDVQWQKKKYLIVKSSSLLAKKA